MKTIEMEDVQHEFSALCQEVASTGQAVVITRGRERFVSIVPMLRANGGRKGSVWGLRRQFEACHGVRTFSVLSETFWWSETLIQTTAACSLRSTAGDPYKATHWATAQELHGAAGFDRSEGHL